MRTASADGFFVAIEALRELLQAAKRNRASLASHRFYAPKARRLLADLRKNFLMMQRDYPEDRYPRVAFQATVLRPLLDSVVAVFPSETQEMLSLVDELAFKANSDLAAELDGLQAEAATSTVPAFLPDDLIDARRGVLVKILWEANRCYDAACYNACATMIRRLVENLIVEAFERLGIGNRIKDNGEYLEFGALIGKAAGEPSLRLTKNTKRVLPSLKFFGDLGAHNRMALVRKADLDRLHDATRGAIEELNRVVAPSP